MALAMKENGTNRVKKTAAESNSGSTAAYMKDTGSQTKLMAVAVSFMPTVTSTTATGKTTKPMEKAGTTILMEPSMKATGSKTSSMGRARKYGRTAHTMKDPIMMARSTERVSLTGQTAAPTQGNSSTITFMDTECTLGLTAASTLENGT